MNAMTPVPPTSAQAATAPAKERAIKEQVVLVLQGGGALGAYQAGVYQALMEGGIEPDWVIGTSIGAINGAIIAGNEPTNRIARLQEFWNGVTRNTPLDQLWPTAILGNVLANLSTVMNGIPGFFTPNPLAACGPTFPLGIERAAYYSTEPLKQTLTRLVDFEHLGRQRVRLSVGAVNVRTGEMRYFDSRTMPLSAAHVMASGALPPAFPAITIDGDSYWDGGIYSNTPIEVVLDDVPRLRYAYASRAPPVAAARRRGPHQGHRFYARRDRAALEGGLRPGAQGACRKAMARRRRHAGRRGDSRSHRMKHPAPVFRGARRADRRLRHRHEEFCIDRSRITL